MPLVSSYGSGEYFAAEKHVVLWNPRYSSGGRPVFYLHGRGSTALEVMDPVYGAVAAELAKRGYLVIAIDAGSTTNWGNDVSISRISTARTWLQNSKWAADASKPPILLGASMGALPALSFARTNSVAAVATFVGAVDLAWVHDNPPAGITASEIETAHGGATPYQSGLPTHNPTAFAASLTGKPISCWYTDNDTITPPARVTNFATAANANTFSYGAQGHSLTNLPVRQIVDWIEATAGP